MRRLPVIAVLAVSASLVTAGCGGGSSGGKASTTPVTTPLTSSPAASPTGSAPADPTGATSDIKNVYATFFSSSVPKAKKLVEDGPALSKAFAVATKLKGNGTEAAKVKTVTFTSPTTANVLYVLYLSGTPLSKAGSTGQAVFVNGHWVVAKSTFCGLVGLGTSKPIPNC